MDEPTAAVTLSHVEGSNNAYLSLRVNGKKILALIDTGCELSLVPASLVRKEKVVKSQQLLRAANGTEIRVTGETVVSCEVDGFSFDVRCLVTEQISELVLGLSWLEQQQAQWHFGKRSITVNGHVLPITSRAEPLQCRKIAFTRDVKIPAMTEMDVEAYAILPSLTIKRGQWATQPQVLESGLLVAGTLLKEKTTDLLVRVMNPTPQDVHLSRGTQCATDEVKVLASSIVGEPPNECRGVREEAEGSKPVDAEEVLTPLWREVAADVPA